VNRDRKDSLIIDDDGDGVANGIDITPFDGVVFTEITVDSTSGNSASIQFMAAGNTTYRIEYSNDIGSREWNYLKSVENSSSERRLLSISDEISAQNSQKYYRVTYQP
jgi:hypothetical protein